MPESLALVALTNVKVWSVFFDLWHTLLVNHEASLTLRHSGVILVILIPFNAFSSAHSFVVSVMSSSKLIASEGTRERQYHSLVYGFQLLRTPLPI